MAALELLALPVVSTVLADDLVTLESAGVPKQVKASALKAYLAA
ncbi:hypothetical protein Q1W73_16420 [Asticcacaulis sp. ZE23SCel15]|nr:hypothetical protein [Asticcacaulis sp. ZE23SCel15]WKL57228.1 hypothetical protein Q1W73_16420 [Asticcacaulis sp. ZE23SCel15]